MGNNRSEQTFIPDELANLQVLMMKRLISVSLLSVCIFQAFSQSTDMHPGYIITTESDTLRGTVYTGNIWDGKIRFKKGDEPWTEFRPSDVKSARIADAFDIYSRQVVMNQDTSMVFVLQILSGHYSLYEGQSPPQGVLFYLSSEQRPQLTRINQRAIVPQFDTYFGDCARKSAKKPGYDREQLKSFVQEMNRCTGPEKTTSSFRAGFRPSFSLGIQTGFTYNTVPGYDNNDIFYNATLGPSARPYAGINLMLNLFPTLSLVSGLVYQDKSAISDSVSNYLDRAYQITNPNTGQPFTLTSRFFYEYRLKLNQHFLEIPLGLRFAPRPFSSGSLLGTFGIAVSIPLRANFGDTWGVPVKVINQPLVQPPPTPKDGILTADLTFEQPLKGVYAGLGWQFKISDNRVLELMLQVHHSKDKGFIVYGGIWQGQSWAYELTRRRIQFQMTYFFSKSRKSAS